MTTSKRIAAFQIKIAAMKTATSEFPGAFTDEDIETLIAEGTDPIELKVYCQQAIASGEFAGADAPEPFIYVGQHVK